VKKNKAEKYESSLTLHSHFTHKQKKRKMKNRPPPATNIEPKTGDYKTKKPQRELRLNILKVS
jgi:hypothetical protein